VHDPAGAAGRTPSLTVGDQNRDHAEERDRIVQVRASATERSLALPRSLTVNTFTA